MHNVDKTILLMISKVLSSVSVLLLSILFARLLSKEDYGTYIQVNMIVQLLGVVLAFGLPTSFYYFLPKKYNRRNLLLRTALIQLVVGSIAVVLLIFFQDHVGIFFNNQSLEQYVKFAGLCVFCSLFVDFIMPVLLYRHASVALAKINIFRAIVLLVSLSSCLFAHSGLTIIVGVFTANYLLGLIISVVILFNDIGRYAVDAGRENVKLLSQLKYSLPLSLSVIFWLLGREIDKYIVSHYFTAATLAIYARGAMELPLVHIVANTIAQVNLTQWVEKWDKGDRSGLLQQWHVSIAKTAAVMFPVFIFFEIIGYDFIVFLYSAEYSESAKIFLIYLFLVPLQVTSYTSYVQATGHNRFIVYGYVCQIISNIVVSVFAIKYFGTIGPAVVTVVGMIAWTLFMIIVIGRIFGIKFKSIFPWSLLGKTLLVSSLAGFIPVVFIIYCNTTGDALIFMDGIKPEIRNFIKMGLMAFVYGLSYYWFAFKFKILDEEDRKTIHKWLLLDRFIRMKS